MRTMCRIFLLVLALTVQAGIAFGVDKPVAAKVLPKKQPQLQSEAAFSVDSARTAVLVMDYQNDIVKMVPEEGRAAMVDRAGAFLKEVRKAKIPVIYVVVRFRPGYPEVSPQNKLFSGLKPTGLLVEGTAGAEIDPRVAPQPGDVVVTKRRVGAFSTTDLETVLRSRNINHLAMFGIATSGVVLSTVRWAADMDYSLTVVSDLCKDMDPEVHRNLVEKVFPWQATVISSNEFLKAVGTDK